MKAIKILFDKVTGDLAVEPPSAHVTLLQEVEWVSEDGVNFNISFEKRSPFRRKIFCKHQTTGLPNVASSSFRYKYTVTVGDFSLDPDIIVDPPDPPGGGSLIGPLPDQLSR